MSSCLLHRLPLRLPHLALAAALLLGAAAAQQAPRHVVFTWRGDTATTLCVNFQSFGEKPLPANVYWDLVPRDGAVADYRHRASGTTERIPGLHDRWVHRVELTGLEPGALVHLVAGDPELGISREHAVRTIGRDAHRLRFVTGGDMGPGADTRVLLRQAARQDPDVALLGGDIAYANGEIANVGRWDTWLTYWCEEMVTSDGRSVPLALAIGNHEVRRGDEPARQRAPFYFGFFAQDDRSYFVRRFGAGVAVWLLDTDHVAPHAGEQAAWLAESLQELADARHKFAVYHVPLFPSHRAFDGEGSRDGRRHWQPLFDQHGLDVAFENHDHTLKRSVRIKGDAPHPDGVLYLGDGCFGRVPRAVTYGGRWYLERQGSVQHFWCVDVDGDAVLCRAIDARGQCLDVHPQDAAGAAEAAARLAAMPVRWELPHEVLRPSPLQAEGPEWRRATASLAVHNTLSAPLSLRIELPEASIGIELQVGRLLLSDGEAVEQLPPGANGTVELVLERSVAREAPEEALPLVVHVDVHESAGRVVEIRQTLRLR